MKKYSVLMHKNAVEKASVYLEKIKQGAEIGQYFKKKLTEYERSQLTVTQFIELLINTKLPLIFAESAVSGDGTDWNQAELSILGDINIAVSVEVYDNGNHRHPQVHETPFQAMLFFTPGALLRNGRNNVPADWDEVVTKNKIDTQKYNQLYERRLLPLFYHANTIAKQKGKHAFITIPGIGCGQFAGPFRGHLGSQLKHSIATVLHKHAANFDAIKAVYYDPHREGENERIEINTMSLLVRPLTKGNENKTQLNSPILFEEQGDDFSNCFLFSFVAWDHVSWPGNDFYNGSRITDDGVKAAATNAIAVMTGVKGHYNIQTHQYEPPPKYQDWQQVVVQNNLVIEVNTNLIIYP